MGSTPSERRDLLEVVAHDLADAHHHAPAPVGHLVTAIECHGDEVQLGFLAFDQHPTDWLACHADRHAWWGLVMSSLGRAHFLDQPDLGPEPIVSTFARSRDGHEVSLLRRGNRLEVLPGRAEGRIPDLLRSLLPTEVRARP